MTDAEVTARFEPGAGHGRLILSRVFHTPPERVWAAISTPERICEWMGAEWTGDGTLGEGARFSYRFQNSDMATEGEVTAYDPPRMLEHTWFANLGRPARVRWEIDPEGSGARLTLTQTSGFADDGPRNAAGWTQIMAGLARLLGEEADGENWSALRDRYAASFPPEATRDGHLLDEAGRPVVRFRRKLRQAPEKVWAALTTPERVVEWMGRLDIEPRVGGRYVVDFQYGEHGMSGEITVFDPPKSLEVIWREPWLEVDSSRLRYDLTPAADGGTELVLSHSFQAGYDAFEYLVGWHGFLDGLEAALEGRPVDWRSEAMMAQSKIQSQVYEAVRGASKAA